MAAVKLPSTELERDAALAAAKISPLALYKHLLGENYPGLKDLEGTTWKDLGSDNAAAGLAGILDMIKQLKKR